MYLNTYMELYIDRFLYNNRQSAQVTLIGLVMMIIMFSIEFGSGEERIDDYAY